MKEHAIKRTRRKRRTVVPSARPRVFHPSFGFQTPLSDIKEVYPDAIVTKLCSDFEIREPDHFKALWNFLAFAGSIYSVTKAGRDDRPPNATIKSNLSTVARLAQNLRAALGRLDADSDRFLWLPEQWTMRGPIIDPVTKTELGLTITREDMADDSFRLHHLQRDQILEAVDVLANYARHAVEQLPGDRRGRPTSEALWLWLTNAQTFWTQILGRPFTFYVHGADPVSDAFRFCCAALKPLAPDVRVSTIGTTMRKLIAQAKKRTGGKSTTK